MAHYSQIKELDTTMSFAKVVGLITKVGNVRSFSDKKTGSQKSLFSFLLYDRTDTINVICWADAVEYSQLIEVGMLVKVEGGTVKNRGYNSIQTTSPVELHISSKVGSAIQPIYEPSFSIVGGPLSSYETFTPLGQIASHTNSPLNFLCVVGKIFSLSQLTTKAGKQTEKIMLGLVDKTNRSFMLTFWGSDAKLVSKLVEGRSILALFNIKISFYQDRPQGTYSFESWVVIDPNRFPTITPARDLISWLSSNPCNAQFEVDFQENSGTPVHFSKGESAAPTDYYQLNDIKRLKKSSGGKVYGFTFACLSLLNLTRASTFFSCPHCWKKTEEIGCRIDGCMGVGQPPLNRLKIVVSLMDHAGSLEDIAVFGEVAEAILGIPLSAFEAMDDFAREKLQRSRVWKRFKFSFKIKGDAASSIQLTDCKEADTLEFLQLIRKNAVKSYF